MSEHMGNPLVALCQLCLARGVRNIKTLPGLCHVPINDQWEAWINGRDEVLPTDGGVEVKPFHAYVEYNGWPAGIVSAYDGEFVAGEAANLDSFLAAVTAAQKEAER